MTVNYHDPVTDADIALKSNTVSGEQVPVHDIHALPGTVEADIGFLKTFLNTLQGIVATGRAAVNVDSTTTGKLDSIISALAGVATLATTVSSGRLLVTLSATVEGYLDGLEGYLSTLAGSVSAGRMAVDLTSTITTYLSNIPTLATYLNTLQGAITAGRMAVDLPTTPTANLATLAGAISSAVMSAAAPDVTASGTLALAGDTVAVAVAGRRHASFSIGAGLTASGQAEASMDGGTTYSSVQVYSITAVPATINGSTLSLSGSAIYRAFLLPAGATHARVRLTGSPSGSATATVRATMAGSFATLQQLPAALGVAAAASSVSVALCTGDTAKLDNLATIVTNQGVPAGGPKFGQNTSVGSGSDAQFGSQAFTRGMVVTNLDTAINLLISHQTGPTAAGSTTRTVKPGMSTSFIPCTNATAIYMRSASGTISACYEGA